MEALNRSAYEERNEMHNQIGKENVELQIDFCNENFSESLFPLRSKTDSKTNNVQIQSESVTVQDSKNWEKNIDPLLDHCYQNINEGTAGCARSIPNPYYVCSHCSKLRNHITKLQQDLEQLKCQVANLEEENKRIQNKRFTIKDIEHSDHLVQLYTGLQNAKEFELLADKLRDKAVRLHYVRGSESSTPKAHQLGENRKKPGPQRKTSVEEEFFMTLVRLRQGLSE